MFVSYKYYLGPYTLITEGDENYWSPPDGFVASLDLRRLDQASNIKDGGIGLFVMNDELDSNYQLIGNGYLSDITSDAKLKDAFLSLIGYSPDGDDLSQMILDIITHGSAPDWGSAVKSLLPVNGDKLQLSLFGHATTSKIFEGPNDIYWDKVQAVIKEDYRKIFELSVDATTDTPEDLYQKYLGALVEKYGLKGEEDWKLFVPNDLIKDSEGPKIPSTTLTDNFNRANANPISANGAVSWTEVNGTSMEISSNEAFWNASNTYARYESDLSTDDMYIQADVTSLGAAVQAQVLARYASAADTCYVGRLRNDSFLKWQIWKRVAGVMTKIAEANGTLPSIPTTHKLEVDASVLQYTVNSVIRLGPLTDTSITGNTRGGLSGTGSAKQDNMTIADTIITALTSTGATAPGTLTDDNTAGTETWSNPSNASSSNNSYATASPNTTGSDETHYLKVTNFGFSVPAGSTINGVMVGIERKCNKNSASDFTIDQELKLVVGGSITGNDLSSGGGSFASADKWPTSDTTYYYGGGGELWGLSLSSTDVNASNFGCAFRCEIENDAAIVASVDAITMTIFYTVSGTTHEGAAVLNCEQITLNSGQRIISGVSILNEDNIFIGNNSINIGSYTRLDEEIILNSINSLQINNFINFNEELITINNNSISIDSQFIANEEFISYFISSIKIGGIFITDLDSVILSQNSINISSNSIFNNKLIGLFSSSIGVNGEFSSIFNSECTIIGNNSLLISDSSILENKLILIADSYLTFNGISFLNNDLYTVFNNSIKIGGNSLFNLYSILDANLITEEEFFNEYNIILYTTAEKYLILYILPNQQITFNIEDTINVE